MNAVSILSLSSFHLSVAGAVRAGMIALMWGDPAKGHAKHPNAVRNETNNGEGHWYDRIAVRKADTALQQKFNAAITAIRANGVYKTLNVKYFDFDVYGK